MTIQATTLTLDQIRAFIDALLPHYRVLAPVARDGVTGFDWIETAEDINLAKGGIPKVSAKKAFLPRTEVLFYCKTGKTAEATALPPPPRPQVVFGLHPCDVQAVKVLDAVFGAQPYPDAPYLARRAVTTIVGLGAAPSDAPDRCFFEKVGIGSMDNRDCDLFLVPLGNARFLLETLTEKGVALANCLLPAPCATPDDLAARDGLRREAAARVDSRFSSAEFHARVESMFDSPVWEALGETCAACGACAYLCPTCHCFDIQDEIHGGAGCRVRNWDTCQFDLFTMHASGHNPRTAQKQRARQRVFHKFDYGIKNFHIPFCVGCGRCMIACPMHGNLLKVLEDIRQVQPGGVSK